MPRRVDGWGLEPGLIPVLVVFTLIGTVYGILSLLRFEAYNSGIFDLGVTYFQIYSISHGATTIFTISSYQASRSIMFLLAPLFGYYGKMPALLVFQSFFLASGGIPLYFISRKFGNDQFSSSLLAISYIIFYPLAGVAWFDFHFMAMFPTLYLTFLALTLYGHGKAGIVVALLCFSSDPIAPSVVGITSIVLIAQNWRKERFSLLYVELILILAIIYYVAAVVIFSASFVFSYVNNDIVFPIDLHYLPYAYLFYLLLPVIFLSFIGADYFVGAIPFLLFIYVNNYQPYFSLMFYQYPALIAPVVFVSASVGLIRINRFAKNLAKRHRGKWKKAVSGTGKYVVVAILILNMFMFLFLTPAGSLVTGSNDRTLAADVTGLPYTYNASKYITYHEYDNYLREVMRMIPEGSSVMIEDNMPQMSYGYTWYLPEWIDPANLPRYAIIDPYSHFYDSGSYYGSNLSNSTVERANMLFSSYGYGIVAELGGIVLLERNYSGPVDFVPFSLNFSSASFFYPSGMWMKSGNSVLIYPDDTGGYGFYGPYTFFVPGRYVIHLNMVSIGSVSMNQSATIQVVNTSVTGNINVDRSFTLNLSRPYLNGINIDINITGFQSLVEFRCFYMHTYSPIIFYGARMTEVSP